MADTLRDMVVSLSLNSDNFTRNLKTINQQIGRLYGSDGILPSSNICLQIGKISESTPTCIVRLYRFSKRLLGSFTFFPSDFLYNFQIFIGTFHFFRQIGMYLSIQIKAKGRVDVSIYAP